MTHPLGYNRMRHDCIKKGCFNLVHRPKIEMFAGCFPRNINFGDVDGWVELNGAFAVLEWKGDGAPVKTAQRISFKAFTLFDPRNAVFVVNGNAETMEVTRYALWRRGRIGETIAGNFDDVWNRIHAWSEWVSTRAAA